MFLLVGTITTSASNNTVSIEKPEEAVSPKPLLEPRYTNIVGSGKGIAFKIGNFFLWAYDPPADILLEYNRWNYPGKITLNCSSVIIIGFWGELIKPGDGTFEFTGSAWSMFAATADPIP